MQILIITLDVTPVLPRRVRAMQVLPGSTWKEVRAALLNEFVFGRAQREAIVERPRPGSAGGVPR